MGQALNIALLPGDGIGPEVMDVAEAVLDLLIQRYQLPLGHTRFDWPSHAWHQSHGQMMPSDGVAQLREFDAMLLGALGDPGPLEDSSRFVLSDSVSLAPLLALRKQLDLWACERPARWLPGAPQYLADPRAREVDMLVIRENSEGEYSGQGGRLAPGTAQEVATQVEVFTARATERLIRHAFRRARQRSTQREVPRQFKNDKHAQVCLITKRNAQPFWGDLYTDTFHSIAAEFPDVDAALSTIATWPEERLLGHLHDVEGGSVALYHQDVAYESGRLNRDGPRHRLWMVESGWRYERAF